MRSSLEQQTKEICELRSLHTQKEAELTDKLRQVEEMLLERTQDLAQTQRKREEEGMDLCMNG